MKANESPPGAYIELDSFTGQVWLVEGEARELAFHYHDLGYLMLAPCTPLVRSIQVNCAEGDTMIESKGLFLPHMAGQFIYLHGIWRKIHRVIDAYTAHLTQPSTETGWADTPVVTMNEIWLRGEDITLTKLEIEYEPRVR